MRRWAVVHTRPHQEVRAEINLKRQGFRTWLPVMLRSRRHAGRIQTKPEPVFPGYVFVDLDIENEPWTSINGTYGVKYVIADSRTPKALPHDFIDALKYSLDEEGNCSLSPAGMKKGDLVKIITGPFVDCVATIRDMLPGDRTRLLLETLGGTVVATVSKGSLVSAR